MKRYKRFLYTGKNIPRSGAAGDEILFYTKECQKMIGTVHPIIAR